MALTPKDVHEKQFTTVKLRTGYDMDEVDAFLDEVESSIGTLVTENDELKAQIIQGGGTPVVSSPAVAEAQKKLADAEAKVADMQKQLDAANAAKAAEAKATEAAKAVPAAAPAVAAAAVVAAPAATTSQDVPAKAFAMLEAAQRTADETVSSAKKEADQILTSARDEARKVTGALDDQRAALEAKSGPISKPARMSAGRCWPPCWLSKAMEPSLPHMASITCGPPGCCGIHWVRS